MEGNGIATTRYLLQKDDLSNACDVTADDYSDGEDYDSLMEGHFLDLDPKASPHAPYSMSRWLAIVLTPCIPRARLLSSKTAQLAANLVTALTHRLNWAMTREMWERIKSRR